MTTWDILLARFAATWPRAQMGKATVAAYVTGLCDLPIGEVEEALVYATRTMPFPPSIAELRLIVASRRLGYPEAGAALEQVERAIRTHEGWDDLPEPARRAVQALGGTFTWRAEENRVALRSQFTKLYAEFCREGQAAIVTGVIEGIEAVGALPADAAQIEAADAPKGSRENPLSLLDLPYTVPVTGRYWLTYGDAEPVQLPESRAGSVLDVGQMEAS